MNKVEIIGVVTEEPLIKDIHGNTIAEYHVAVARGYKSKQEADIFKITAFGKRADVAKQYIHTGMQLGITGSLKTSTYPHSDGTIITAYAIVADTQEFLSGRGAQGGPENANKAKTQENNVMDCDKPPANLGGADANG